jgi:hypothetical protein
LLPSLSSFVPKVSREVCVCFRLFVCDSELRLGYRPSSFEKKFYRLPFTPPSLVRRFGPSDLDFLPCLVLRECSAWLSFDRSERHQDDSCHGFLPITRRHSQDMTFVLVQTWLTAMVTWLRVTRRRKARNGCGEWRLNWRGRNTETQPATLSFNTTNLMVFFRKTINVWQET